MRRTPIEVDFEISKFHIRGRISEVSETGYVHIRYARLRAKDLLKSWIYHLVCCHTTPPGYQGTSFLICKDSAVQFDRVTDGERILQDLLELFHQGLVQPIHFFPESSWLYAQQVQEKGKSDGEALKKVHEAWMGGYYRGEMEDQYYTLCFRNVDPIDSEFRDTAIAVFGPIVASQRKVENDNT